MKEIFPELAGNSTVKELVGREILLGRHSHAYIFEGKYGSGKHTAARLTAAALLCENRGGERAALPCGICPSCRKIADGNSLCVEYINRGDAASLSVEAIRQMLSAVSYIPDDGDYKVYIIEEAEKMTPAAQNALLLTLEEPPAHAVFILLTEDSSTLLDTVRSRCHILKTEAFSAEFVENYLKMLSDSGKLPRDCVRRIPAAAASSGGSIGAALSALTDKSSDCETAQELTRLLCQNNAADTVLFCRTLSSSRDECHSLLTLTLTALRDLIALKIAPAELTFYSDADAALALASQLSLSRLAALCELVSAADEDIYKKNASVTTVLCFLAAQSAVLK